MILAEGCAELIQFAKALRLYPQCIRARLKALATEVFGTFFTDRGGKPGKIGWDNLLNVAISRARTLALVNAGVWVAELGDVR